MPVFGDSDTERPMPSYKTRLNTAGEKPIDSRPPTQGNVILELMQSAMEEAQEVKRMKPKMGGSHLLLYIEDMHLTKFDQFQDNPAAETIRELTQYQSWYSNKKRQMRHVENVNLIGCMRTNSTSQNKLPVRLLRHFSVIGVEPLDSESTFAIVNKLLELNGQSWISDMQEHIPRVARAIFDLFKHCAEGLRPTPMKVQYQFNQREIFKLVSSISKVESNYIKNMGSVCRLFCHEAMRQFGDRILMKHDLKKLIRMVKAVCLKHFCDKDTSKVDFDSEVQEEEVVELFENFSVKAPEDLWFSTLNDEVEGYYLEITSQNAIKVIIQNQIERYNEQQDRRRLNLVLYDELIRHLLKILRALGLHGGHLMIVGLRGFATGELVKLASFISGKKYNPLEINPEFTDQDWSQELRNYLIMTGQSDQQMCVILEEYRITNPLWYNDVETIMAGNNLTSVLEPEDITAMLTGIKVQQARKSREKITGAKGHKEVDAVAEIKQPAATEPVTIKNIVTENTKQISSDMNMQNELNNVLLMRIKKNMHFITTFTPSGHNFRQKMQTNSEIMANSQIIWVQNLQADCLSQIGEQVFLPKMERLQMEDLMQDIGRDHRLDDHKMKLAKEVNLKVLQAIIMIYLQTLSFAKLYTERHQHHLFFTPVFFLRCLDNYRRLLIDRQTNVLDIQHRYKKGLDRIKETIDAITQYYKELEIKTPILIEKQKRLVAIIIDIQSQFDKLSQNREDCQEEEHKLSANAVAADKIFQECQYALDRIVPSLNDSINSMRQISKYECAEIHSMQHPPKLVKQVMKAVCLLLDVQPIMKQTKSGDMKPSFWRAAIGAEVLGNTNLPKIMETFDRNKLTDDRMALVEEIIADPEYTYENAKKSCIAIEGIYGWVKALRDYFYIFKELEPRRDALILAEKQHNMAEQSLEEKRAEITSLEVSLENLHTIQMDKTHLVDELKTEIQDLMSRKRRADALMRGLNSEKQKWIVCTRMLESKSVNVSGDVVLAAAIVTYGGPFTYSYRRQLIDKWHKKALTPNEMTVNDNFQIQELFGDNFKIKEWHANGLPKDLLSTDNALIMEKSKQYPMFIDPQQQASHWLKQQYATEGLIQTKLTDPNFKRTLEVAIDMGTIVLIENMPERVDIHIESLVKQEITQYQDTKMIKFCRKQLKLNPGFSIVMLTSLSRPRFDVNLTNYVTLINFFITVEGLSQNLLSLVVANERPDLEEDYNRSLEVTYTNVTMMKEIENDTLIRLEKASIDDILADEQLIEQLRESRTTAERIAQHLRKLQSTTIQLEKCRVQFTPVAYRAATLYFGIQDLHQTSHMYQYSLKWFLAQFMHMLKMVNQLNNKTSSNKVTIQQQDYAIDGSRVSPDERVVILITTFTQEIMKKVTLSVFQEDRQFITYFLALRVLQAEQLTDDQLIAFAVTGSKEVTQATSTDYTQKNSLSWLTESMWSDLLYLESLRPFNNENLSEHILNNQEVWDVKLFKAKTIDFDQLPNKDLINLAAFTVVEIRDAMKGQNRRTQVQTSMESSLVVRPPTENRSVPGSRQTSRGGELTEQQVLDDEDLWAVSESESDQDDLGVTRDQVDQGTHKNKEFYEDKDQMNAEEKEMARFMTEKAPGGIRDTKDFDAMHVMTKKEKRSHTLRQLVLKRTVELAIAKTMRPDLIQSCLHALVATIYDFNYASFQVDILSQFIDHDGTLNLRNRSSGFNTEISMPERRRADNNIQLLMEEALSDSQNHMPVLFLVSHSVNVLNELQNMHQRHQTQAKFHQISCAKTEETRLKQVMKIAMMNGDWLLVQNLQIEPSWIEMIEAYLHEMTKAEECHQRFRLWLTIPQMDNCSDLILKACVKVALQQPINIKMKIERHMSQMPADLFRRNIDRGTLHKNLYFGLCYLHAVLDGRRAYGPLGWNLVYDFDKNDFDISESIVTSYIAEEKLDQMRTLRMMKFIFSKINFAGKINRSEDQRKLNAHVDDLFNEEISLAYSSQMDLDKSHFGIPNRDADITIFVKESLPNVDHAKIFGFNQAIQRQNQRKVAANLTGQLKKLNQQSLKDLGFSHVHTDLRNQLNRFSQERLGKAFQTLKDDDSLIANFIKLQEVMQKSSLDQTIADDSDRYDERVDKKLLAQRDLNDRVVSQIAQKIRDALKTLFKQPQRNVIDNEQPLQYAIAKEVENYTNLKNVMLASVEEFLSFIDGSAPMPENCEMLWLKIQNNHIPQGWLDASYDTAHTSLAHYLADFADKVKFWNQQIEYMSDSAVTKLPAYLISAFYNPGLFLTAQLQQSARRDGLNIRHLRNNFTVSNFMDSSQVPAIDELRINQNHIILLEGLWIEGAEWDLDTQALVDQKSLLTLARFPVLEVEAAICANDDQAEEQFEDDPQLSPEELKELKKAQKKLQKERALNQTRKAVVKKITENLISEKLQITAKMLARTGTLMPGDSRSGSQVEASKPKYYVYQCPVFATTNRLSLGGVGEENKALFYVPLRSLEKPRKWVKRSVALLMEPALESRL